MQDQKLGTLLHNAERTGSITGLPIARGGTRINHLFFADDSLLFCRANFMEWGNIQEILDIYEKASGQKLNRKKLPYFLAKTPKTSSRNILHRYRESVSLPKLRNT
jgi:hypothetical protein